MNTETLYQHINRNIPLLQSFAKELTNDFETARFLYQETVHQAMKNKHQLREDTMKDWLINSIKKNYAKISKGDQQPNYSF